MLGIDSEEMERRLSQWTQGFAGKAERFQAMRAQMEQVRVTGSSADGAVRVTVDSTGALIDLTFTERIRDLPPPELAILVMTCLRHAQQQLAPLVQDAMQATVGDEEHLVESVMSNYRERFGEDLSAPSTAADPGVLGLGVIEDGTIIGDSTVPQHHAELPAEPPRRYRRAAPPEDEEYFADRGYLR